VLEVAIHRTAVTEVPAEVWRFPDITAAIAAIRAAQVAARDDDGGTEIVRATDALALETDGSTRVVSFTAELRRRDPRDAWDRWLELPAPLAAGWYLVILRDPAGDLQTLLQVTDLAAYAQVSWTRTVVWVNDIARGTPVAGATVTVADGPSLGTTGPDGLLDAPTPALLVRGDAGPSTLVVRTADGATLVPFGTGGWSSGDLDRSWDSGPEVDAAWTLLYTDRTVYRTTDTVNAWGLVRGRDDGVVPDGLALDLVSTEGDWPWTDDPAIVHAPIRPSGIGAYTVALPLADVPEGWYQLLLRRGDVAIAAVDVEVAPIVKPELALTLTTRRHVYIAGETVLADVTTRLFDGTAAPAVPVAVELWSDDSITDRTTTDARGAGAIRLLAPAEESGSWRYADLDARIARGESGEADAHATILLFPSAVVLDGRATVEDGTVRLRGDLSTVDRPRLERELARGAYAVDDPRGTRVAGSTVRVRVVETTPTRRQTGTTYAFIARRVVPVWDYGERRATILERALVTDAEGRFALDLPAIRGRGYELQVRATDASGRTTLLQVWAQQPGAWLAGWGAYLTAAGSTPDIFRPHGRYAAGEAVAVVLREGGRTPPSGGTNRYLFLTAQRGIRSATIQDGPVFRFVFRAADAPLIEVSGIRFTGRTYIAVPDGFAADFAPAARALTVTITPGAERYAPGDTATVTVDVRDPAGRPVDAQVVLRGVDEKLLAIGAATTPDPLADLYRAVSSGTSRTYASHQLPRRGTRGEGGDTGGGGGAVRSDFRDQVLFRLIATGEDGRAVVTFPLPDDITAWHVSGTALTARLQAGEGSALVRAGLPFLVELVAPPLLLASDRAAIRVRAYGSGLAVGERVVFSVAAPTLGLAPVTVEAAAFAEATVALPALVPGTHAIEVRGTVVGDGPPRTDALRRTVSVVPSHLSRVVTEAIPIAGAIDPPGGTGMTTWVVTDAGRAASLPILLALAQPDGVRAEQILAASEARRILAETCAIPAETFDRLPVDPDRLQGGPGGIRLLPYASADLRTSALVGLLAPAGIDPGALAGWLRAQADEHPRELPAVLAGLAGLGEPVAREVRAALAPSGRPREARLFLGLAAAASGDGATAEAVERELVAAAEVRGPGLRLTDPGGLPDPDATALLALLAAWVGDRATADAADAWLATAPPERTLVTLHRLGAAALRLARASAEPARFALVTDGTVEEVALAPGVPWTTVRTPAQRVGVTLVRRAGDPVLVATWRTPLDPATVVRDPAIVLERTISPTGPIPADALVTVRVRVAFGAAAIPGCHLVTDHAPAGLAPVREERGEQVRNGELPMEVRGTTVTWCVWPDRTRPTSELVYTARVVAPGTYTWEPVTAWAIEAPERIALGEAAIVETR
ncbi:MAG: alpha-2-macroglobulin family protein, partial [Chloroflexota bacterium]